MPLVLTSAQMSLLIAAWMPIQIFHTELENQYSWRRRIPHWNSKCNGNRFKKLKGKVFIWVPLPVGSRAQKLAAKARRAEMTVVENEIEADWCITAVLISSDLYKKMTLHRLPVDLRNEIWFEAALDSKSHLPPMTFAHLLHCSGPLPLSHFLQIYYQPIRIHRDWTWILHGND